MNQIIDSAEKLGWKVKVKGNLFIFEYPEHEEYNFRIWAETIGEYINKVQLLAFNYKDEDKQFSAKLNMLIVETLKGEHYE